MKMNCGKNYAICILTDAEKESILETYNIIEKLITALDNSAGEFEPQDGRKFFRAKINGDELITIDELEDLSVMMEIITSVDYISCSLVEDEGDCD